MFIYSAFVSFSLFLSAWHSLHPWSSTSSPTHYRFIIWHLWLFIMRLTMQWFSVINCPFWKSDNVNVYIEIRAGHKDGYIVQFHWNLSTKFTRGAINLQFSEQIYCFVKYWEKKIDYRIIDTVLSLPHAYFEIKHTVQHNSGPSNISTQIMSILNILLNRIKTSMLNAILPFYVQERVKHSEWYKFHPDMT